MSATSADVRAQGLLDDIWETLEDLYNTIVNTVGPAISSISTVVGGIVSAIDTELGYLYTDISDAITSAVSTITGNLSTVLNTAQSWIEELAGSVITGIGDAIDDVLAPINSVATALNTWLQDIWERLQLVGNTIASAIGGGVSSIVWWLRDILGDLDSWLDDAIGDVEDAIETWLRDIGNKLASLATAIGNALASVSTAIGSRLAEMSTDIGTFLSDLSTAIGNALSSVATTITGAVEWVATTLQQVLSDLLGQIAAAVNSVVTTLAAAVQSVVEWANENILAPWQRDQEQTRDILKLKAETLVKLALGGYSDPRAFLDDLQDPPPLLGALAVAVASFVVLFVLQPAVAHALEPLFAHVTNRVRMAVGGTLLTPAQAVEAHYRQVWGSDRLGSELAMWGYDGDRTRALVELQRPLLSPGAVQAAFLRGLISAGEHDRLLAQHGYTEESIRLLKSLYLIVPPVADLIRMGVREAFSPEIAQRFGQYEDYPQDLTQWAQQLGLSEDWAKRYWAAHWDLPSAQMGFEMLHRGIIDENELKLLLRALDIMPYWREKLIQLSYSPYTRVDVRRMFQLGVLDANAVYQAYRDIGYNDERARRLTEFTIRYYSTEEEDELETMRQLTRAVYVNAYQRGVITRDEAMERLREIGYLQDDAELLLRLADVQRSINATADDPGELASRFVSVTQDAYRRGVLSEEEARRLLSDLGKSEVEIGWYLALGRYERGLALHQRRLAVVAEQYQTRILTRSEAQARLASLGCAPGEIAQLLGEWDYIREHGTRHPTEAQLRAAWGAGIITRDQYAEELRGLGYAERYVQLLVNLAERRMG